jgi:hypothetical protein
MLSPQPVEPLAQAESNSVKMKSPGDKEPPAETSGVSHSHEEDSLILILYTHFVDEESYLKPTAFFSSSFAAWFAAGIGGRHRDRGIAPSLWWTVRVFSKLIGTFRVRD